MESIGARLKNLRLEKGLTLEEVNKKTKIHLNILKAIEEDSLIGLNPVYIKGFIKIYCKFLSVDPKECIPDYKEPYAPLKLSPEFSRINQPEGSFLKNSFGKLRSFKGIPIKIKPILITIAILALALALFNLGKFISMRRGKQQVRLTIPLPGKSDKLTVSKIKYSEPARPKKEVPLTVLRLGLRAKEDSRVEVKCDGRLFFSGVLKKGKFESWTAKDKVELSLGNAGVVELELDGRIIPHLGRKGQTIRGIRVTRNEGLVIPR